MSYLLCFLLKIGCAKILYDYAQRAKKIEEYFGENEVTKTLLAEIKELSEIQRYTVYKGRIL